MKKDDKDNGRLVVQRQPVEPLPLALHKLRKRGALLLFFLLFFACLLLVALVAFFQFALLCAPHFDQFTLQETKLGKMKGFFLGATLIAAGFSGIRVQANREQCQDNLHHLEYMQARFSGSFDLPFDPPATEKEKEAVATFLAEQRKFLSRAWYNQIFGLPQVHWEECPMDARYCAWVEKESRY